MRTRAIQVFILLIVFTVSMNSAKANSALAQLERLSQGQMDLVSIQKTYEEVFRDPRFSSCEQELRCLKNELKKEYRELYQQDVVGEIVKKSMINLTEKFVIKDGILTFKKKLRVDVENFANYFKNLVRVKKMFGLPHYKLDLDPSVSDFFHKYYKRKIPGMGKIHPLDYVLYYYSWSQISEMSIIAKAGTQIMQSPKGLVVIHSQSNPMIKKLSDRLDRLTSEYALASDYRQSELDQQILQEMKEAPFEPTDEDLVLNEINSLRQQKEELIGQLRLELEPEVRKELYGKMAEINFQMKDREAKAKAYVQTITLSQRDIYHFSLRYVKIELLKSSLGGALNGKMAQMGDLVMAFYLSKGIDHASMQALIAIPELQEGWMSRGKKTMKSVIPIVRAVLPLIPGMGGLANFGFVIFDSIHQAKRIKEDQINEAHYY